MSDVQRDREERQHVIEILQKEKKTALHDNRWAFDYAIASIKTDLRYDLLYEETSEQSDKQADKPTTKNDVPDINVGKIESTTKDYLGVDAISRKAVQTRLKEIINEMETIFADIREREVNDSVCGLCEYDCDHGLDGFANECPGFEKDDCFKLNEKYKAEWLDISNLPSVTPQFSSELDKNSKKLEKGTAKDDLVVDWENYKDVDGNSLDDLILEVLQNNFDCGNTYGYKVADEIIGLLPSVTPIRPKGYWISHREHCENLGVMPSGLGAYEWCSNCDCGIDVREWHRSPYNYCPNCGADMREVEDE